MLVVKVHEPLTRHHRTMRKKTRTIKCPSKNSPASLTTAIYAIKAKEHHDSKCSPSSYSVYFFMFWIFHILKSEKIHLTQISGQMNLVSQELSQPAEGRYPTAIRTTRWQKIRQRLRRVCLRNPKTNQVLQLVESEQLFAYEHCYRIGLCAQRADFIRKHHVACK